MRPGQIFTAKGSNLANWRSCSVTMTLKAPTCAPRWAPEKVTDAKTFETSGSATPPHVPHRSATRATTATSQVKALPQRQQMLPLTAIPQQRATPKATPRKPLTRTNTEKLRLSPMLPIPREHVKLSPNYSDLSVWMKYAKSSPAWYTSPYALCIALPSAHWSMLLIL